MTIKELIQLNKPRLSLVSKTPKLDLELILEYVLGLSKVDLIIQESRVLSKAESKAIEDCLQQRLDCLPMAYILGYKEFYGRKFITTPQVLIPRPESEAMIEITREQLAGLDQLTLWDIGTGSGCLAITLALELPVQTIIASDISPQALQIAQNNAIILLAPDHPVRWIEADLIANLPGKRPDLILANLPYLDESSYTDSSLKHEPKLALYSDQAGLDHYQRLINQTLNKFGLAIPPLLLEINPEQEKVLIEYIQDKNNLFQIRTYPDLQGLTRHIYIKL